MRTPRDLPSVDRLAGELRAARPGVSAPEAVHAARAAIDARRQELLGGDDGEGRPLVERAAARLRVGPRRVLNGTGVVVHTNLGRAPLAEAAALAVAEAARGSADLELDLERGGRGARDAHVAGLLAELTGADDGLAVNNGAGATLLAAAALGGPGRAVVVSRGELVEIGGGFRVPDVVRQSGARLVEVGTTNRTRAEDYARALEAGADVVLRVHPSNFRAVGFVEAPTIEELCALGAPVIDDAGSGALAEGVDALAAEPPVRRSVAAGAAVVCFSGDKLLGGPQAGVIVGTADAVDACRRHPLARALRVGRLPLAALAATLALYRDPERAVREIPVLAMLTAEDGALRARAEALASSVGGEVVEAVGRAGGGALPLLDLPGWAAALPDDGRGPDALAAALRAGDPPLVARIADGRVVVDVRTLGPEEDDEAAGVIRRALEG